MGRPLIVSATVLLKSAPTLVKMHLGWGFRHWVLTALLNKQSTRETVKLGLFSEEEDKIYNQFGALVLVLPQISCVRQIH